MIAALATLADWVLSRTLKRWRRRRTSQKVAALSRGETVRIRCAARFRNSGGARHRANLTVGADGVFLSTVDDTVSTVQLGTPPTSVTIAAELSMIVCDVAGRQLEVLLPAGEDRLFKAVAVSLLYRRDARSTAETVL